MFPTLRVSFSGKLEPDERYDIYLDITPVDNKRYRYAYHRSSWIVAGKADPAPLCRLYRHPDSPFTGDQLTRKAVVSFEKLKLTNNSVDRNGHVSTLFHVLIRSVLGLLLLIYHSFTGLLNTPDGSNAVQYYTMQCINKKAMPKTKIRKHWTKRRVKCKV